jgi:SAM-dependent methyltransferase
VTGIDVFVRPVTQVPVTAFDGETVPYPDGSFDVVTMVDVLHHTDDPLVLLKEAARVARVGVVLKDHLAENGVDRGLLRFMDWVGNKGAGVVLPYNYWSEAQWQGAHHDCGLRVAEERVEIPLYPRPASWVFGRKLHLLRRLEPDAA